MIVSGPFGFAAMPETSLRRERGSIPLVSIITSSTSGNNLINRVGNGSSRSEDNGERGRVALGGVIMLIMMMVVIDL